MRGGPAAGTPQTRLSLLAAATEPPVSAGARPITILRVRSHTCPTRFLTEQDRAPGLQDLPPCSVMGLPGRPSRLNFVSF